MLCLRTSVGSHWAGSVPINTLIMAPSY